jgi:hypothetical protein
MNSSMWNADSIGMTLVRPGEPRVRRGYDRQIAARASRLARSIARMMPRPGIARVAQTD